MATTPGVSRAGASAAAASRTCTSGAAIRTSSGHCHKTIAQERPRMRTGPTQAPSKTGHTLARASRKASDLLARSVAAGPAGTT